MAVKNLVDLYESRSSPASQHGRTSELGDIPSRTTQIRPSLQGETLSPSPAASVAHPLLRRREPSQNDEDVVTIPQDADVSTLRETYDRYNNAMNVSPSERTSSLSASRHKAAGPPRAEHGWFTSSGTKGSSQEVELKLLSSPLIHGQDTPQSSSLRTSSAFQNNDKGHVCSTVFSTASSSTAVQRHHFSSSTTLVASARQLGPHRPVPATTVFSRKAFPLHLPGLDDYLASLSSPSFPSAGGQAKSSMMFAPMDKLAASGKSLADLGHNAMVAPPWRNRNSVLSTLTSLTLGIIGSSALSSLYSIQGPIDLIQIFALILNTLKTTGSSGLRTLFLVTIPNILALNVVSKLVPSIALLIAFMLISGGLLYYLYRVTSLCISLAIPEGLQRVEYPKNSWIVVLVVFMLTLIYLPLSTMAVHVLVWSDDFWVVPNPYINSTTNPPTVEPLGPVGEFRDPLDFCWTTTMQLNEINYAPLIIILAVICFLALTLWYPIHLFQTIRKATPVVDAYTELGAPRSKTELNREYQRLLLRDRNPLTFLYNDFRRGWGAYEAIFLVAKLTTLLTTAVVTPYNCLFRSLPESGITVARQTLLVVAMLVFFILQCVFSPFLDPVNNASEFTSRFNYVLTSAVALGVALNIPGRGILNGPVLYVIYIVTYGLCIYFTIIDWNFMRRFVKRMARRVDFSIDVFSPRIDLSASSPHAKRRIWQEAITTLFLTTPDCEIPRTQPMQFKQARDSDYPPYLVDFSGTAGERLIENLKILREVGYPAYKKAVALTSGPDHVRFRRVEEQIQSHFLGPDCYWKPPQTRAASSSTFFGNAWWIPFPPTVVIRYDDGPQMVLRYLHELELYVTQNSSPNIQRRREIRLALRALDGQVVSWPYDYKRNVGSNEAWCCCRRRYRAHTSIHYASGILHIKRCGQLIWDGMNLGSGFDVQLTYAKDVQVDGSEFGVTVDFELTRPLARFLALNEQLIMARLADIEGMIQNYRRHCRRECQWKRDILTYSFLTSVYDKPQPAAAVADVVLSDEHEPVVRRLVIGNQTVFDVTYERFLAVSRSQIATWWYIFWDDVWRRNYDTIRALKKYEPDFNPHYPTSVAYTPLPRPALEVFLTQRGLLHNKPKWADFFDAGLLNKMYLRMNDIVFHGTDGAMVLHLGDDHSELDMEEVDAQTLTQPSTLGTGPGTDYDDVSIRARPMYRWEGIFDDTLRKKNSKHHDLFAKLGVWFGVTPLWRAGVPSKGLAIDVQLQNGRYVLLEDVEIRKDVFMTDHVKDGLVAKSV